MKWWQSPVLALGQQFTLASSPTQHQQLCWWPSLGNRPTTSTRLLPARERSTEQTGMSPPARISGRLRGTLFMPETNSAISSNCNAKHIRNNLLRLTFDKAINIAHYIFILYAVFLPTHINFIRLFSFIPFLHIVRSHPGFLFYHSPSVRKQ